MGVVLAGMFFLLGWWLLGPWTVMTAWEIGPTKGGILLGSFGAIVTALGIWIFRNLHFKKR